MFAIDRPIINAMAAAITPTKLKNLIVMRRTVNIVDTSMRVAMVTCLVLLWTTNRER